MKYIKVEIDPKVLQVTEWSSFIPPSDATFPKIYKIADGNAKIFFSTTLHFWISGFNNISYKEHEDKEITSAPTTQISEDFVLRLVAISHNPELSKDLLK